MDSIIIIIKPRGLLQIKGSQKEGKQLAGNPIKQTHRKSMTLGFTESKETKQKEEQEIHVHMHQPPIVTKKKMGHQISHAYPNSKVT